MGAAHQEVGPDADYSATREALASMLNGTLGKRRRGRHSSPRAGIVVAGGVNHGQIAHTIIMQAPLHAGPCIDANQQRELVNRLRLSGEPQALLGVLLRVMGVSSPDLIPASRWPEAWRWACELGDLAATAQMMTAEARR